jgi:SAM-dependent methyltransferase
MFAVSHGLRLQGKRGSGTGMNEPRVPNIFNPQRRAARVKRALKRQRRPEAARYLLDDMAEDMLERLAFVRHTPTRALVLGDVNGMLTSELRRMGAEILDGTEFDLEQPWPIAGCDFIAVLGVFDAINDLPGALIHLRQALAPGGLAIASFIGGASLATLRAAMMAAEPERPAARIHPMVDHRAAPQLLGRAGWKDPVVDTHTLKVRYSSLGTLVDDLRDQGLGNALARPTPALGKAARKLAEAAFAARADLSGKVTESFEIITLTGRRSLAGT